MTTWQDFPNVKTIADDTDEVMLRTPSGGAGNKNARITIPDLRNSFNPADTIHAKSEADLETALGNDLIIPTNESKFIFIDESFTLTKPFKKQAGSSILIISISITITLTYTGPGALIQMDGAVQGNITQLDNITLKGNLTNKCFDIDDTGLFLTDTVIITQFMSPGFLKSMNVIWDKTGLIANISGMAFINNPAISVSTTAPAGIDIRRGTLMSFITTTKMDLVFVNNVYTAEFAEDSFIFLDPNSDISSSFKVRDSGIISPTPESLFQKGTDMTITAVTDNGNGKMRCTSVGHGQLFDTYAVLRGFTEPSYNKTALIMNVDDNTLDVEEIAFVGNDSGIINRASLDSTDPRVIAEDNPEQRDSMFTAEAGLEVFGSEIVSSSLAQGQFEVIDSPSWQYGKLERFGIGVNDEGQVVDKDFSKREYNVRYSATIEKAGGGSVDIGIILLKDGTEEVAFNPPHTDNSGKIQISATDLIELTETEGLQVAVKNYSSTAAVINTSQVSIVLSKG